MGSAPSRLWTICVPLSFHATVFAFLWWKQRNSINAEHLVFEKIGHVAGIFIYPVKSWKGISRTSARSLIEGLEFDRRWVVVDKDDVHIKSFDKPVIAQVTPKFEDGMLCPDVLGMDTLKVDINLDNEENIRDLRVLRIASRSQYVGDEAAAWFSTLLNIPGCKMYQIYEPRYSIYDKVWGDVALPGDRTGYAACSALLLTSEASLDAQNEQLPSPIGMDRFLPNIFYGGTEP